MQLGTVSLENNLILAPILNVTTAPYRRYCRSFYPIGLVSVPMLNIKGITQSPRSIKEELFKIEEERPISVQLIGNDKESLKNSIDFLDSYKFDVLDINAGCPSKRALKARSGGYLLKDLKILKVLLNTAVKYSSKPVSLKTRLGFEDSSSINELVKIANDSGIEFLIVHARTVKDRFYDRSLDLDALKELKEKSVIPVVGNGDICDPLSAKFFLDYTNVDAIMIGRGTIGNPEIFRQIDEYIRREKFVAFKNSKEVMKRNIEKYEQLIENYLENIKLRFSLEDYLFVELKRNSIWLTKNLENSTIIREKLSKAKNLAQLKGTLNDYFNNN